jgi:hypothetical protein
LLAEVRAKWDAVKITEAFYKRLNCKMGTAEMGISI